MKILLLFPALALTGFIHPVQVNTFLKNISDSTIISHVLDGYASEWPAERFETNKETGILYAVDNNDQTLYIAMKLPNISTQIKVLRQGMSLFIDTKDKKKRAKGIGFPVNKLGNSRDEDLSGKSNNNHQGLDFNAIKSRYALNIIGMKLFGFTDGDPVDQELEKAGSANIAFTWDSLNVLTIEYAVPLKMLEDNIASLNHKEISIGWSINTADLSPGNTYSTSETTTTTLVGVPSRSGAGVQGGAGRNSSRAGNGITQNTATNQPTVDKALLEQSFWTKYILNIQAN